MNNLAGNKRKSSHALQSTKQQKTDICVKTHWCHCRELDDFPHLNEDELMKEPRSDILHYLLAAQKLEDEFGEAAIPECEKRKRAMYERALNRYHQAPTDGRHGSRKKSVINYQLIQDMIAAQMDIQNQKEAKTTALAQASLQK